VKPFFARPATQWRHSGGKLHVYVVAPEPVRAQAAIYQAAMAPFGDLVSLQPLEHLHFTVQMIERHHLVDTTPDDLAGLEARLRAELAGIEPFEMTTWPGLVGVHGVTLAVPPPVPGFAELVHRSRAAITHTFGSDAVAPLPKNWGPHLGLGYSLAAGDPDPLIRAVHDLRYTVTPVTFTVDAVVLVAVDQDRDRGTYTWTGGVTIPLGS
jgi:2'-5' RNA ligase